MWDQVARDAREAGDRAAALCVDDEAIHHYDIALDALARLPETPDTARAGVELRLAMRAPLWRAGQVERLFALFNEARALATPLRATQQLDAIDGFLVQYCWAKGDHEQALEHGARRLAAANAHGDLGLEVTALLYTAQALLALGRYRDGVARAHEIIARLEGPPAAEPFGLSGLPYSSACAMGAECLAELGDRAGALGLIARGRAIADATGHPYTQAVLGIVEGAVLARAGRTGEAILLLESAARTCREKNFEEQLISALGWLGHAYVLAGRGAEAIDAVRESIDRQERATISVSRTQQHAILAAAHLALGDLERAAQALEHAFTFAEKNGERGFEAWARLTAAHVARARDDRVEAEQQLDAAQEIAEELEMAPLVARCRALARLT